MTAILQRILYVEDEVDIQAVAKIALETLGELTVKICSSGTDALQVVADFLPDMILLDVMMPDMDGPSTLKALREHRSLISIPVVFMTAKVQPHELAYYKTLGAEGVIAKPFDAMSLADQVQKIWENQHVAK